MKFLQQVEGFAPKGALVGGISFLLPRFCPKGA
jgi:hypothetical protein